MSIKKITFEKVATSLFCLPFITLPFIILFCVCMNATCHKGNKKIYYEDLDGNKGITTNCSYTDKGTYSGGMGTPICFVGKKVIAVKWYEDRTKYDRCYKKGYHS